MSKMLDMNGKIFRVMSRVGDTLLLNLLMILCSLPVVTIGAATAAVYDMSLRLLRKEEGYIIPGYFKAFRSNFKQATELWIICLAVIVIMIGDLLARPYLPQFTLPLSVVAGIQGVLLLAVALYAFPMLVRYENTLGCVLYNSAVLALYNLPKTAIMVLISLLPVVVFLYVPLPDLLIAPFITLCLLLWFGGAIYLNSMLIRGIFQQQFGSEVTAREESEEEELDPQMLEDMKALDGYGIEQEV